MGRNLLVTGGSRGIGAAIARQAAARGYAVCLSYRTDRHAAEAVVADIAARDNTAIAVPSDVAVEVDVLRLFAEADERLGPLDAFVNNAGILARQMRVDEMDAARLNRVFATNITGAFLCAREAVRRMSTRRESRSAPPGTTD